MNVLYKHRNDKKYSILNMKVFGDRIYFFDNHVTCKANIAFAAYLIFLLNNIKDGEVLYVPYSFRVWRVGRRISVWWADGHYKFIIFDYAK